MKKVNKVPSVPRVPRVPSVPKVGERTRFEEAYFSFLDDLAENCSSVRGCVIAMGCFACLVVPIVCGCLILRKYCEEVKYKEELRQIELEKKRQEILNQNTIEWNNAVNSCEH